MLETEYKSLLTEAEYEKIAARFAWDRVYEQTNHYYGDAEKILAKNRIMFRVRVKDGKSVVQVKLHKNSDSPLQICEETEFPIDGVPETIENGEKYTGIKTETLRRLGFAKTLRRSKMWDPQTEICLDRTEYLGITDYEIEIEYSGEAMPEALQSELKELGIEFRKSSTGKFTRFLNALTLKEKAEAALSGGPRK